MAAHKHAVARGHELGAGGGVEVELDSVLLLLETGLCLLHVVGGGVLRHKGVGFGDVVRLGGLEERLLELLAVDVEVLAVGIGLVEAERDERVDDLFDERGFDDLAVALLFDLLEQGVYETTLLLDVAEHVLLPLDEREDVDGVDVLAALVLFSLDPVAVEVCKEAVDKVGAGGVAVPFGGVVAEQGLF